jgi:hypothetical protein
LEVVGGEAPGEGEHPLEKLKTMRTGANGMDGGEFAGTSLSLLALAVNFRFLPIYER